MNALVRERGFDQVFVVGKPSDSASPTAAIHAALSNGAHAMTKKSAIDRVLMAYRPLYLRGLMLDGQYRPLVPVASTPAVQRRRMLLAALTGLRHIVSFGRNAP
jgi:hypothetical protein